MGRDTVAASDETSQVTIAYYEQDAEQFWLGTRDHDVSQNIDALLGEIEGDPPFRILDFGCGPGRDLRTFAARGHTPTGLDGAARFVQMARAYAGVEVWEQDFLALDLPDAAFDGVFANASLFHVPTRELRRVLGELRACLRPRGALAGRRHRRRLRRDPPLLQASRKAARTAAVACDAVATPRGGLSRELHEQLEQPISARLHQRPPGRCSAQVGRPLASQPPGLSERGGGRRRVSARGLTCSPSPVPSAARPWSPAWRRPENLFPEW
jgi:SAM-dependent methyltransferase